MKIASQALYHRPSLKDLLEQVISLIDEIVRYKDGIGIGND